MNTTEKFLILCLVIELVLIGALLIYIGVLLILFIKKGKIADSNKNKTPSDQSEVSKNVPLSSNNLAEIWSLYVTQQSKLLEKITPIINILLQKNNSAKINKMLKKAKNKGQAANGESTVTDNDIKNEESTVTDSDIKIIWESFIERQKELVQQFETVFKDAELYFQRMIEPLDSCSDEEEKRTGIWAQIERYKWTSVGLSQVLDISNKLLQCKEVNQYSQLSNSLAQIMFSYRDVIK